MLCPNAMLFSASPCRKWARASASRLARDNAMIKPARSGLFCESQLEKKMTEAVKRNLATVTKSIVLP